MRRFFLGEPQDEPEAELSDALLPMAGVALLVLIMLMMGAPDLMSKTSVKVNVPKAHVMETELEDAITLTLTRDGQVYLYDDPIDRRKLRDTIRILQLQDTVAPFYRLVIIRADEGVAFGQVLELLDASKKAGSKRVALAVVQEREEARP